MLKNSQSRSPKPDKSRTTVLHTHTDGTIWLCRASGVSKTKFNCDQFLENAVVDGTVKVLGTHENAYLLCRLYEKYKNDANVTLKVGTPQLWEPGDKLPSALLGVYEAPELAASLGGWHKYTAVDHIAYQLNVINYVDEVPSRPRILSIIGKHPMMPYVRFSKTLDPFWFGLWVAAVRDPRWYICLKNPERTSKLERYMGLYLDMQERVIRDKNDSDKSPQAVRCRLTRRCWLPSEEDKMSGIDVKDPRNFMFRAFASRSGKSPIKAMLRTSQLFTRFARAMWLNSFADGTPHVDAMFDPEQFFTQPDEFEAYAAYKSQLKHGGMTNGGFSE